MLPEGIDRRVDTFVRVSLIILGIWLQVIIPVHAFVSDARVTERIEVVIVHSYHADYPWTKSQHEAFISTLRERLPNYSLGFSVEYLDTKRIPATPKYFDNFTQFLNQKHKGHIPKLIYVTDDSALRYISQYQGNFLNNAPVIFSGINDLALMEHLDRQRYTGVYELKELKPNLDLVRSLLPDTRKVIFVGDGGVTSQAIDKQIRMVMPEYPEFESVFISSQSLVQISRELESHRDGVVLLTTIGGVIDEEGVTSNLSTLLQTMAASPHMVISMEDGYLINGVIGGYVTSGARQGQAAALLAENILKGVPI